MAHDTIALDLTADDTVERLVVPAKVWLLLLAAVFATYVLTLDNGAVLGHVAAGVNHEFFHDARHFVGFPCH